ncbi:hypothetical protein TNCV_648501 [Trichonephila clavipes]|uniref:Uncharacterized protein n=1 Tax=Trichonephila clavipes TaxID=2585209 RepID=A0A8X6SJD5_TRICX|nr:hypothetical protein TNCV_648501 [Trichonephila clavipes]
MEGEERWEPTYHLQDVFPQNWGRTEPKRTVTCMVIKATANDRRILSPFALMNFVGLDLTLSDRWRWQQPLD